MTSAHYNARKAQAAEEMQIFDQLPECIREAMNNCKTSVKASSALNALLRGVECYRIVETINRSKERKP